MLLAESVIFAALVVVLLLRVTRPLRQLAQEPGRTSQEMMQQALSWMEQTITD